MSMKMTGVIAMIFNDCCVLLSHLMGPYKRDISRMVASFAWGPHAIVDPDKAVSIAQVEAALCQCRISVRVKKTGSKSNSITTLCISPVSADASLLCMSCDRFLLLS